MVREGSAQQSKTFAEVMYVSSYALIICYAGMRVMG